MGRNVWSFSTLAPTSWQHSLTWWFSLWSHDHKVRKRERGNHHRWRILSPSPGPVWRMAPPSYRGDMSAVCCSPLAPPSSRVDCTHDHSLGIPRAPGSLLLLPDRDPVSVCVCVCVCVCACNYVQEGMGSRFVTSKGFAYRTEQMWRECVHGKLGSRKGNKCMSVGGGGTWECVCVTVWQQVEKETGNTLDHAHSWPPATRTVIKGSSY